MVRTSTDVINDQKLDSLEQLLKIKHDNPTIETRHIMKMVEEILYPSGSTWIADNTVQKREYHKAVEISKQEADELWENEDFSQKYELIGKIKTPPKNVKFQENPWGVVIGRYDKCPLCKQVSIESVKLDKNSSSNRTYVRHQYTHFDKTTHSVGLETFDGQLDYDDVMKRVNKK